MSLITSLKARNQLEREDLQYTEVYLHSSKYDSGNNNEPIYQLQNQVKTIKKIKVQSVVIPFTYYGVNANNNSFSITETTGTSVIAITLTPGNYTSSTFPTLLKTLLEAESIASGNSLTYTVSIVAATNKLLIEATGNFLVSVANSSRVTGFVSATTSAASATSQNVVYLSGTNNLYLRSNLAMFLQRDSIIENNLTYNNVLKAVPIAANSGDIIYYQFADSEYLNIETDLSDISLYLTDDDGFRVDFNGGEWDVTLQIFKQSVFLA